MKRNILVFAFILLTLCVSYLFPQGTYYDAINVNSANFVNDLKTRVRSPYTKISYDNFDETNVANYASQDNGDGTRSVVCVYSGYVYTYTPPFAWTPFSREHTFCHSWMPTYDSESGNEYSDQHHLFPTHQNGANGVRSNHPLGIVTNITSTFYEGKYGTNSLGQYVYEPRSIHKGDAARALLYMLLRYDDVDGKNWDMNWLNTTRLPSLGEAPQNLNLLLSWHEADPPDNWERGRNNYIYTIQGNRNPFIDHPEYANYINFNTMTYISANSNTTISFIDASASVSEAAGTYNLSLSITNPNPTVSSSVKVFLTSGSSSDIGNYTTQTIVFPAGSSANQNVTLAITDDALKEGSEVFIFELQDVSGGTNAEIGTIGTFSLTIQDNESRIYISEYSDAIGSGNYIYEFVELYNDNNTAIDISGYVLKQYNSTSSFTFPANTIISANGFLVLGRNSTQAAFLTFWGKTFSDNVVFINSGDNKVPQINRLEKFQLVDPLSQRVDPVLEDETYLSIAEGNRVYRLSPNNLVSDWKSEVWTTSTPGTLDYDSLLPVELISFFSTIVNNNIVLNWETETETENSGFEIQRIVKKEYLDNNKWETIGFIKGSGNSNSPKHYSFIDKTIKSGKYCYRLKQIDNNGHYSFSEVLFTEINLDEFSLEQNYPNPFNPVTNIQFRIPNNITQKVSLKVFDALGREVALLVDEIKEEGVYNIEFNSTGLSNGIYFYRLVVGEYSNSKMMILLK